jgi:hypothetical protein
MHEVLRELQKTVFEIFMNLNLQVLFVSPDERRGRVVPAKPGSLTHLEIDGRSMVRFRKASMFSVNQVPSIIESAVLEQKVRENKKWKQAQCRGPRRTPIWKSRHRASSHHVPMATLSWWWSL